MAGYQAIPNESGKLDYYNIKILELWLENPIHFLIIHIIVQRFSINKLFYSSETKQTNYDSDYN